MDVVYVNRVGSGMSLYLDGQLVGTNPNSIALDRHQIGSNADTVPESPLAIMNAAVLYDRALSPAEIAAHWAAVPEPSTWLMAAIGIGCLWLRPNLRADSNYLCRRIRLARLAAIFGTRPGYSKSER